MDRPSGPTDPDSEGPKINGSVAAFYALIIVLSLIVAVAFAAVLYLWLEERAHPRGDGHHAHKPIDEESVKDPSYHPHTRWYSRIFGIFSNGRKGGMRDIGSISRGQGWIQAGTSDEWETDESEEYSKPRALSSLPREYDPSLNTQRTSATYSIPQRSLVHSFASDRSSFLPSDIPAMPYEDPSAPSNRYSVQSIYSQLLPPLPGSGSDSTHCSISTVSATPVRISTSPHLPSPPVSIEYAFSDSHHSFEIPQKPSLRTFGGGTKFIEAL